MTIRRQDLASLYRVAVKFPKQPVKRHREWFPSDFVLSLEAEDLANVKSQFVISRCGGLRRARPCTFPEQGVAMLSSSNVNAPSKSAARSCIRFATFRQTLEANPELAGKFAGLETRVGKHDKKIDVILEAIGQLKTPAEKPRRETGFHLRETVPPYRARKNR
jgi:hypothetical protein